MQRDERLLIVKQEKEEPATDNSTFVFPEVQEAMKSMNQLDPKGLNESCPLQLHISNLTYDDVVTVIEWMNQRFFDKLAQNPKLPMVGRFDHKDVS
ncbi:hypothetical protein GQ600_12771 [Phytophthora cactorum]|nr:hypothetical protein GQ600_12771 [Phytophthora cactorum]